MRVALLFLLGCAQVQRYAPQIAATTAGLATACDWRQTHRAAATDWGATDPTGRDEEGNPLLGPRPDTSTVDGYFSFALGGEAVAGAFVSRLPGTWKWVGVGVLVMVAAVEVNQAQNNQFAIGRCL